MPIEPTPVGMTTDDWMALGGKIAQMGLSIASIFIPGGAVIPLTISYLPQLQEFADTIVDLVVGEDATPEKIALARAFVHAGLTQAYADRERIYAETAGVLGNK